MTQVAIEEMSRVYQGFTDYLNGPEPGTSLVRTPGLAVFCTIIVKRSSA